VKVREKAREEKREREGEENLHEVTGESTSGLGEVSLRGIN